MKLSPPSESSKVIVRLPNAVGDTVMVTPVLRRLASVLKPEQLHICGPAGSLQILAGNPWTGGDVMIDRRGEHSGFFGRLRLARELREAKYTLAIIMPNSIGAALPFTLARIPERLGYYKEGRAFLLTAGRPRDHDAHGRFMPKYTGSYFDELCDLIPSLPPSEMRPQLFTDADGEREFAQWQKESGYIESKPLLILVPGAAFGPSKIWVPERYAEVANALVRERDAQVLVSCGPGEESIAEQVKAGLDRPPLPEARVSLKGLKSIFSRADFVLTNDTGPRHFAVAFDVPNVTIMGPNDPRYTHLPTERGEVVREVVACSPCQLKVCPLAEQVCMTRLSTAHVLERCNALWPDA